MADFEPIFYEAEEVGKRLKSSKVKHTWMLEVSGTQFIVEYYDSRTSGKVRVTLNEQEVFKGNKQGTEFTIPFHLGRQATLLVSKGTYVDLLINSQYFKHVWARVQQELPIPEEEFEYDFPDSPQKPGRRDFQVERPVEVEYTEVEKKPALYEHCQLPPKEQRPLDEIAFMCEKSASSEAAKRKTSDLLEEIFNPQHASAPTASQQPETLQFPETKTAPKSSVQSLPSQPIVPPPVMPFMSPCPSGPMYMTPHGMMYTGPVMGLQFNPAMYMSQPVYMTPGTLAMPTIPAVRRDLGLSTVPNITPSQYHNQGDLPDFTPHAGLIGSNPVVAKNSRLNQEPVILERGNPFTSNPQAQDTSFSADQQLHSIVDLSNLGKNMHSPPLAQRYQDQVRGVQVPGSDPALPMKDLPRRN